MPVNFPSNPSLNQSYSLGSKIWIWNGVAWDLKTANTITVSLTDDSNNFSNVVTDVKGIRFDANSGFDVTDLGSGNVKIAMNSTFKTWKITGQSDLIANGLDTIEFVGSNGVVLTSNTLSNPKSITFDTSQIFNSVNTVSIYANTPSHVANSAAIYANGAFAAANNEAGVNAIQNTKITFAWNHANSAFDKANNEAGVNATQNNSIEASFDSANSAGIYANGAFTRANNSLNVFTGGTITGDITITGNLNITGNTITHSANDFIINDPIVLLANNNPGNVLDLGFVAHYEDGGANTKHTGLIRHSSSNTWYLFKNYEPHIQENNILDINDPTLVIDNLRANLITDVITVRGVDPLTQANAAFDLANNEAGVNATQNTNITFAWNHANSAFDKANTGGSVAVGDDPPSMPTANSLWWQSNTATLKIYYDDGTSSQWVDASPSAYSLDQIARDTANAAFIHANAAYNQANTGGGGADQYARNTANAAFIRANNSIDANNGGTITGNLVIGGNVVPTTDNTYYLGAQSNRWHSLYVGPGSVDIDNVKISNTGTNLTITGTSDLVVSGLPSLQTISLQANSSFGATNSAGTYANSAFEVANSAATAANTPSHVANSAAIYANGAFAQANTDVTNISVTSGTYGNATHYPIVTLSSNGRINTISTIASGGGGGSSTDQYARNHANSAYGQANNVTSGLNALGGTVVVNTQDIAGLFSRQAGFIGRYSVNRLNYQNGIASGWTYDWTTGLTAGSFCRMPVGGGHNETDSPNQWVFDKRGSAFNLGAGQTTLPYDSANDPRIFYKKYYQNTIRSNFPTWSQREEPYRSEIVGNGNVEMIGQMALVHGNSADNWLNPAVYFNGPTPNTTNTLATQGAYLDPGTTSSVTLAAGEKIYFVINGQRARLTYTTASGWTSGNIDVDDYNGSFNEITNDQGSSQTFYYSYYTQGQDTQRTFVKVFKRIENSSFSTTSARDKGLNLWNYYWRNDQFNSTADGFANGIISPSSSIYFSSQRLHRIFYSGPAKTLPTNNRPYSFAVKMNLESPTGVLQNLFQFSDAVNSVAQGMVFTLNIALTGERRINMTAYNASVALVTNLKVWQFAGDSAEDVNFYWSWNPLDPVYPGRLYVNDKLVWCTATNPTPSLGYFGVGATTSGTANGFQGYLNLMTMMPEAWGNHITQGSFNLDWDATTGLASTTYNGTVSVTAAARAAIPRKAYIRSSSTFVQGAYFNMENGAPYSAAGSFTASCVTTADSRDVTFSNTVGGWINPSGVYLVTGTNIRTTRNVYTTLVFGDKGFGMDAVDDLNTATASGTTTLTFTRINGGYYDAFYTTGAVITQPGNSTSLSKTNVSGQLLTNCLAGVNSTTYLAFGAFPNISITMIAGSAGDETLAGSQYLRTAATQDASARNIQGMLGAGKKPTISGGGIPSVSATVDYTYIEDLYWDHYARGAHLIILSQAKTGNATASSYTCVYVPGNRSTFDAGLDNTGGESSIIDSYNYSLEGDRNQDVTGFNCAPNNQEIEYGLGLMKSWRIVPPKGYFDSGIFKATGSGYFRRMYVGYSAITALINFGTSIDLNRTNSFPSISYPTTAATANGLTVTVSAGNYYRVVVLPLSAIISQ